MQSMKSVSDLYEILAEKYDTSPEVIKQVTGHVYWFIGDHVRNRNPQPILLHNLGTFYMQEYAVDKMIDRIKKHMENDRISEEKGLAELEILEELKKQVSNG